MGSAESSEQINPQTNRDLQQESRTAAMAAGRHFAIHLDEEQRRLPFSLD